VFELRVNKTIFSLMRRLATLLICVAGGLALGATAHADAPAGMAAPPRPDMKRLLLLKEERERRLQEKEEGLHQHLHPEANAIPALNVQASPAPANNSSPIVSDPNNPYSSIVTRNVFGLNPVPVVDPNAQPPGPPPPKITLTGITTIFGPAEALFKVAGVVRAGGPPKDESYIFTEGEAQDDVEVTAIDTKKNIVTFTNHGVVQVIPLVDGVASTGSAPSQPSWPGGGGPRRFGRRIFPGGGNSPMTTPGYQPQSYNNSQPNYNNGNNSGINSGMSGGTQSGIYNPSAAAVNAGLSGDDEAALMAAQKAQLESEGNPEAAIFPPTKYDQQAQGEPGGGEAPSPSRSR
jgi:hypothetical protein